MADVYADDCTLHFLCDESEAVGNPLRIRWFRARVPDLHLGSRDLVPKSVRMSRVSVSKGLMPDSVPDWRAVTTDLHQDVWKVDRPQVLRVRHRG